MMKRIAGGLVAGSLLSGCVATSQLQDIAIDSNRLVADTADEQTFLNILRAKDRLPMHFTSFKVINGNLSISTGANLDLGRAGTGITRTLNEAGELRVSEETNAANTSTPKFSASIASEPSFELAVYDTKEFQSGILTPVAESTIEYYLQNGWPQDFLTALFVSKVQVTYDGTNKKEIYDIINDPDTDEGFGDFINQVRMVSRSVGASSRALVPLSMLKENLSLADLSTLDGSKYEMAGIPEFSADASPDFSKAYVERKRQAAKGITFENLHTAINSWSTKVKITHPNAANISPKALKSCNSDSNDGKYRCTLDNDVTADVEVFLRSPEAINYFLGSYVRCDIESKEPCTAYVIGKHDTKVIKVSKKKAPDALITASHRGQTYHLVEPDYARKDHLGKPDHRGSQAIVLIQQLINLQKSADSLPVSSSIKLTR